jgi:putative membrane protein
MIAADLPKLPEPVFKQNNKTAKILIWSVSVVVFIVVAFLSKEKLNGDIGFNPHIFAAINAVLNSMVALLLVAALLAVKSRKYVLHKKLMLAAITLSVLFLISYICHHLLSGDTKYGDINHDGILSMDEKTLAGSLRYVYYFILITHIPLAGIILPFILFTAYRALSGSYLQHKKLARITWPIWLYVAISGVIVYLMISPYYP